MRRLRPCCRSRSPSFRGRRATLASLVLRAGLPAQREILAQLVILDLLGLRVMLALKGRPALQDLPGWQAVTAHLAQLATLVLPAQLGHKGRQAPMAQPGRLALLEPMD